MTPKQQTERALRIIVAEYGVPLETVTGGSFQRTAVVPARDAVAYYLWSVKKWSLPRIGAYLHRDHSSAASAIGRHMLRHQLGENWMTAQVRRQRAQASAYQARLAEQRRAAA